MLKEVPVFIDRKGDPQPLLLILPGDQTAGRKLDALGGAARSMTSHEVSKVSSVGEKHTVVAMTGEDRRHLLELLRLFLERGEGQIVRPFPFRSRHGSSPASDRAWLPVVDLRTHHASSAQVTWRRAKSPSGEP